jgi:hypothetical protein
MQCVLQGLNNVTAITLWIETPLKKATHACICRFYYQLDPWRKGEAPHIITWEDGPDSLKALLGLLRRVKVRYSLEVKYEQDHDS